MVTFNIKKFFKRVFRYPILQLRFNVHDCHHRLTCYKKSIECRFHLPQKHRNEARIVFDDDECKEYKWHHVNKKEKTKEEHKQGKNTTV